MAEFMSYGINMFNSQLKLSLSVDEKPSYFRKSSPRDQECKTRKLSAR